MNDLVGRRSILQIGLVAATAAGVGCDAPQDATVTAEPSGSAAPPATTSAASAPAGAKSAPPVDPKFAAPADVAEAPADATKTASGLAYKNITKGSGTEHPAAADTVKVHYTGWTKDGKMFDSSLKGGEPIEFPLNGVIPGWTEGVQLMVVGDKTRFWIPGNLAYGDTPRRPGAPAGQLTFDVELIDIKKAPPPPPVPEDVAAPPKDAKKTKSGLYYKVQTKGTGTKKPTEKSRVEVHYTGWTKDGKMFDSSVVRGKPARFGLNGVIKGWTEGVQLMVEGEKTRFWIPADLAYGENPGGGRPGGQLTFDIELLKILD
ncbi:MAG: peptidylprolyl isomerase [Polyangiaceae bacterium]|nr:peptidylprolyl isomerase [Polyangiaceae bacterium]